MSCTASSTFSDGFNVGEIVWARRDHDGIYWPGKINCISNNLSDTSSTNKNLRYQLCSYLIQFFGYNQTHWTSDVLPYRQYRDYMSRNLLIHFESYPQIKYQFLNAINQADYNDINENSYTIKSANTPSFSSFKNNPNYNYNPQSNSTVTNSHSIDKDLACRNSTPQTTSEYSMNHYPQSSNSYHQYLSNYPYNTQLSLNNYCSCCTQPSFSSTNQFSIETSLNPIPQINNEYHRVQSDTVSSQTETFHKINSIIIITTKTYSNSSFISYIFNCFTNFSHHSIIYIDDLTTNDQYPNTLNISYLICLDHFDSTIQQILNSTILNNLNAHINYLFLVINAPSHELVKHLYSTVMDKRTIFILHYHSTFDNEPLLLCSGNRTTFEMIQSTLLKYLCSKIKYIESRGDEEEQFYSINDISFGYQINNIKNEPMVGVPNQPLELNSFINYPNISKEYLPVSSIVKHSKKLGRRRHITNLGKKIRKRKFKHRLPKNRMISVSSSEYNVHNILNNFNSSK